MATSLTSENRANRAAAAQALSLEADKAATQAETAKQAVRAAKAVLKRTRKLAKASKKIAKQARKKAKAALAELHARSRKTPVPKKPAVGDKQAPAGGKVPAKMTEKAAKPAARRAAPSKSSPPGTSPVGKAASEAAGKRSRTRKRAGTRKLSDVTPPQSAAQAAQSVIDRLDEAAPAAETAGGE
jgi:hypothetical protein